MFKYANVMDRSVFLLALFLLSGVSYAHTTSIGYENAGAGAVTFWYGTYHNPVGYTEGSFSLTGPGFSATSAFTLLVSTKPAGLIDGTTNFYSDGTTLIGTPTTTIRNWQGVTMSGLTAGTYTFTYIPIGSPTATWQPIDSVILSSTIVLSASIIGSSFVPLATPTSVGAATVLDSLAPSATGDMGAVITTLQGLSAPQQTLALQHIAPNSSRAVGVASTQTIDGALDTVAVRLENIRAQGFTTSASEDLLQGKVKLATAGDLAGLFDGGVDKKRGLWMKVFGVNGDQDSRDGYAGYSSKTWGSTFGADVLLDSAWVVGAAFTYAGTKVDMHDYLAGDNTKIDTYQLTAYASRDFGTWYLDSALTYAKQKFDSRRDTSVSGVANGNFDGDQWAARVNLGWPIALNNGLTLTPLAGLEWNRLEQNAYTESGAGALDLSVQSASVDRVRSAMGLKLTRELLLHDGMTMRPSAHLVWRHEFHNNGLDTTSTFTGGGAAFTTPGQTLAKNTYNLGLAIAFQNRKNFTATVQLDGEAATGYSAYAAQVSAQWRF